jgi:hypothetical protein
VHKRDGPNHGFGTPWGSGLQPGRRQITFVGGGNELPLWGPGARGEQSGVDLLRPGAPRSRSSAGDRPLASDGATISIPRPEASKRCWTWMSKASRSPFPWFPDPQPQSSTGPSAGSGAAAPARSRRAVDPFRYAAISTDHRPRRLRRQSQPALVATQRGGLWLPISSDNRLLRLGMLTRRHAAHVNGRAAGRVGSGASPADAPPPVRSSPTGEGRVRAASHQIEDNKADKADSHQGKEDDQVPDNFHH